MAEGNDSGSNVAIIALIIIAVLVAGAAYLFLRDGEPTPAPEAGPPSVIEHNTVIDRQAPGPAGPPGPPGPTGEPAPEPAPAPSGTSESMTIEQQQNDDGTSTTIKRESTPAN